MSQDSFFSILLGQSEYSTKRAKWFYHSAESIINWIIIISLAISLFWILYLALNNIALGIVSFLFEILPFVGLIIGVIFSKLMLLGIGALIRICEVLEISNGLDAAHSSTHHSSPLASTPASPSYPQTPSTPDISDNDAEKYGIKFDGEKYIYKTYKYDKLIDAINYAKKDST